MATDGRSGFDNVVLGFEPNPRRYVTTSKRRWLPFGDNTYSLPAEVTMGGGDGVPVGKTRGGEQHGLAENDRRNQLFLQPARKLVGNGWMICLAKERERVWEEWISSTSIGIGNGKPTLVDR